MARWLQYEFFKSLYLRSHLSLDIQTLSLDIMSWQRYWTTGGFVCSLVCRIVPTPHWLEQPFVSFFHLPNSQSSKLRIDLYFKKIPTHHTENGLTLFIFFTWTILQSKYFSRSFFYVVLRIYFRMYVAVLRRCLVNKRMAQIYCLATPFAGFPRYFGLCSKCAFIQHLSFFKTIFKWYGDILDLHKFQCLC